MLHNILEVGLQPDVFVLYANTGKERLETLDFIHEIEQRWGVRIYWLERRDYPKGERGVPYFMRYLIKNYDTASREGEPFDTLIKKYGYLPNPRMRFCTQELKIRVMSAFMRARCYDTFTMVEGLRHDEPRRIAKMAARNATTREIYDERAPLHEDGITEADVMAFWSQQPFDLQLEQHEGNCDLCFLKTVAKKQRIAKDHPHLLQWWVDKENLTGQPFRLDQPLYIQMKHIVCSPNEQDLEDCGCTD